KARYDDILVVPFSEINGVSFNDEQVRLKCGDFVVVSELKESDAEHEARGTTEHRKPLFRASNE
ncbi:MAG: hypothetical protein QGH62_06205, partial [Nitrospinaceae bacterium]|nr:hypothetical protein [Nitrospinaceae bacterium]